VGIARRAHQLQIETFVCYIRAMLNLEHKAMLWKILGLTIFASLLAPITGFAQDKHHILELWWAPGPSGWHFGDLTSATGAPAVVSWSQPMGYVLNADSTQHVVYIGPDRHIYELWWAPGPSGWHWSDLTSATGAPLAGGSPVGYVLEAEGTQHVVYRATVRYPRE
jgi:hypothetical protein